MMRRISKSLILLLVALCLLVGCGPRLQPGGTASPNGENSPGASAVSTDAQVSAPGDDYDHNLFTKITVDDPNTIWAVAVDEQENIYTANYDKIMKIAPDGKQSVFADGLSKCYAVTYEDGVLYATAELNGVVINAYDAQGKLTQQHLPNLPADVEVMSIICLKGKNIIGLRAAKPNRAQYVFLYDLAGQNTKELTPDGVENASILGDGSILITSDMKERLVTVADWAHISDQDAPGIYKASWHLHDIVEGTTYTAVTGNKGLTFALLDTANKKKDDLPLFPKVQALMLPLLAHGGRLYGGCGAQLWVADAGKLRDSVADKKVLTVAIGELSSYNNSEFLDYFQRKHPEIIVRDLVSEMGDYSDEILADFLSGESECDVVVINIDSDLCQWARSGILMDLSENVSVTDALNNPMLFDGLKELCSIDGSVWGVPFWLGTEGFAINKKQFQALGLPIPGMDWTVDDMVNMSEACHEKGISLGNMWVSTFQFDPYYGITEHGGYKPGFDTPEFLEYALKKMESAKRGNIYFQGPEDAYTDHKGTFFKPRQWNETDLLWDCPFSYRTPMAEYLDEDSVVIPAEPAFDKDTPWTYPGGRIFCVPKSSKSPELAALFLSEWMDETFRREHSDIDKAFYKDFSQYKKLSAYPPGYEACFAYILRHSENIYHPSGLGFYQNTELAQQYEKGELSLEECLKKLQEEAEKRILG